MALALAKAHVTGPHRTLMQDPVFAIDQLVEIAIRALSPAVNDTFTALTCIDWLSAGLSRVSGRALAEGVYRDHEGRIRLIEADPVLSPAWSTGPSTRSARPRARCRRSSSACSTRSPPSARRPRSDEQRQVLVRQGDAILRLARQTVAEPNDLADIEERHRRLMTRMAERSGRGPGGPNHYLGKATKLGA